MKLILTIFVIGLSFSLAAKMNGDVLTPARSFFSTLYKFSTMKEIWKDIENYEGFYQISNFGRVKSLGRVVKCKGGVKRNPERILARKYDTDGYVTYCLSKLNKKGYIKAHREVLKVFSTNPNNYPQVNHKNGVKDDNNLTNLEWCTISQNGIHRYRVLKIKPSKGMLGIRGKDNPLSKPVVQCDLKGNEINTFYSIIEAANSVGAKEGSGVSQVCRNIKPTYKGFIWKYKD